MPKLNLNIGTSCALGLAVLAVSGCLPTPEGTDKDDVTYFEEAVAANNCKLVKSSDYYSVQFEAGLTREQVLEFAGYELGAGRAERLEGGGIRLTDGPCAAGATPMSRPIAIARAT